MRPFILFSILALFLSTAQAFAAPVDPVDGTAADAAEVHSLLDRTAVSSAQHYCLKDTMTCRSIFFLKDKTTGQPVDAFYVTFYSSDRQVASTEYAIPNADGTYNLYTDFKFDGLVDRTKQVVIEKTKRGVRIDRSKKGTVVFVETRLTVQGTTRYILADLVFKKKLAYLEGYEYDSADPTAKVAKRIDYPRIK